MRVGMSEVRINTEALRGVADGAALVAQVLPVHHTISCLQPAALLRLTLHPNALRIQPLRIQGANCVLGSVLVKPNNHGGAQSSFRFEVCAHPDLLACSDATR